MIFSGKKLKHNSRSLITITENIGLKTKVLERNIYDQYSIMHQYCRLNFKDFALLFHVPHIVMTISFTYSRLAVFWVHLHQLQKHLAGVFWCPYLSFWLTCCYIYYMSDFVYITFLQEDLVSKWTKVHA